MHKVATDGAPKESVTEDVNNQRIRP